MRWFPLALFFGASLAVAQNTPSSPPTGATTDSGQIRVEGTILSLNGAVVRKATVRLQGTGGQPGQLPVSYIETTDNGGKFVFDDVAPGRYLLSAEKPGFVSARYGARANTSPGTQLTLTAGTETKDLAIKMTPQGVIAGKVLDQDGDPVISVQVQALRFTYARGRKQLQPSGGATTNDLGEYRLINLLPGRYYVSATDRRTTQFGAQERPGRSGTVPEGNITTYYPNGADASSGVAIDVPAGGEMRGVDIRLLQAKVYAVRGKVVDDSGAPVSALVAFNPKEDAMGTNPANRSVTQSRNGTFEFRDIVPGTYVLQFVQMVGVNGNQPPKVTGRMEVTVADANIDGLTLALRPSPEITGTVKLEDGDISSLLKPAQNTPGVGVAGNPLVVQAGRLALNLIATESVISAVRPAQVKDDGTFQFDAVGTGKYMLNVMSPPPGTYLKSARFAGQDVTNALIDTTSGTGGTLDLVLSSKGAKVKGSVQNEKGEALAGVMVTLWPKTPDASLTGGVHLGFTDPNGGFAFQSLAPGDYYVAGWEDLDAGLAQSADFLSHFTSEASAITLAEGGQESKDLKPVPADKVAVEIAKLP